jgi:hypothetical protein
MEMTVAIEEWLKRIPDFRLVRPARSDARPHGARAAPASESAEVEFTLCEDEFVAAGLTPSVSRGTIAFDYGSCSPTRVICA